jgi:adenylate cyclase
VQSAPLRRFRAFVQRVAQIGVLATDSAEEALRKETLVLFVAVTGLLSFVWVGTYAALGLYLSAAIPFAYQVVSAVNLAVYARTKRYRFFRACELSLALVLPFLLQLSLGGFFPSSGVVMWSFSAPLGALLFSNREAAARWFVAFLFVIALSAALEPLLSTSADVPHAISVTLFALNILGVTATSYLLLHYFVRERDRAGALIVAERERSERLLLNVLPEPIAERLKSGESPIADRASDVGVLFADIAGFTPLAETMPPDELVRLLDDIFTRFDHLVAGHRVEKIKTIGDAYMAASGLLGEDAGGVEDLHSTCKK